MTTAHLEENLQRAIDEIREKVVEMGEMVETALRNSLEAINNKDRRLAYSVILRDRYIDEFESELDQLCQEFIVRQQPAAGHLRFVYAAIKINNELERVGDYAESICRQFSTVTSIKSKSTLQKINDIANLSIPMLRNAVAAFNNEDEKLARETKRMDNKVDEIRYSIHHDLMELSDKGEIPPEGLMPLMIIASRFERVADQSCNICEEVLYMTTGKNVKHVGKENFRILFVDERDACRGQIAEGIGNSLGLDRFIFSSAGVAPKPVDKRTVSFMADKGIDISDQSSKYINQVVNVEDYSVVVALCEEAEAAFPPPPSKTVAIRWNIDDPSKLKGTEEEIKTAYEKTYEYLNNNIKDLVEAIIGNDH